MKNVFIGFLLIFLDFNLSLGNSKIGLIPDRRFLADEHNAPC